MSSYRVFQFAAVVMLVCFAAAAQASTVNILTGSDCDGTDSATAAALDFRWVRFL